MGLGITINAQYNGPEETCRSALMDFFNVETSPVPGQEIQVRETNEGVSVGLFFADEDIFCEFVDNGLTISVKTSGSGPGYHAYVAGVLHRLRKAGFLDWNDEDVEDETGFWKNNDYAALQEEMAEWLNAISHILAERGAEEEISRWSLGMPADWRPDWDDPRICHKLGWFSPDFFDKIATQSPSREDCKEFFLWWEREPCAEFHLKCALCMMWCDCNWLSPETERETRLYRSMLMCLEKAWEQDHGLKFPTAEWKELAKLNEDDGLSLELSHRFPEGALNATGVGYRRGRIERFINGWSISMPGTVHENFEDNTFVYWVEDRCVRITSLTVTGDNLSAQRLIDLLTQGLPAKDFDLPGETGIKSRITPPERHENDDGTVYYGINFMAAKDDGNGLYMSLYYDGPPENNAWALDICASVR